jgi:predicted site-specific integrase-resolvase
VFFIVRKYEEEGAMTDSDFEEMVGVSQAAAVLGISRNYTHRLFEADKLRGVVTPIGRLITRESLEEVRVAREEKLARKLSLIQRAQNE